MPTTEPYLLPDFAVTIDGSELRADLRRRVVEIRAETHLDLAAMFRMRLADPAMEVIDDSPFPIGAAVRVEMGYSGALELVMEGEIAALQPSFPETGMPSLTVIGYDRSYAMRHGCKFRQFLQLNDSGIARQLADLNGLGCDAEGTSLPTRESVSHLGSDWELLERLAERNGFEARLVGRTLRFGAARPGPEPPTLTWGQELRSFSPRVTASGLARLVKVRDHDDKQAQAVVSSKGVDDLGGDFRRGVGRFLPEVQAKLSAIGERLAPGHSTPTVVEADALAASLIREIAEGLVTGSGRCLGTPALSAGGAVRLAGVGERYGGEFRLRHVAHAIGDQGYETHFEVGPRHSTTLTERLRRSLADGDWPGPARSQPPLCAQVTDTKDPQQRGRVRVRFPQFSEDNQGPWARVATLSAGDGAGTVFPPEVGDDVLVAFERGDVDRPIVVGGLWNGKRKPPEANADGLNNVRVIKTRGGHLIKFDDTKGGEALRIEHPSGSSITLGVGGDVAIETKASLTLKGGSIRIEAASGDVEIKAMKVDVSVQGTMDVH